MDAETRNSEESDIRWKKDPMRANPIRLDVAIERFLDTDKRRKQSANTRRQYRRVLGRLAANNPGLTTDRLTDHHMQVCVRDMEQGAGIEESRDLAKTGGRRPGRGPQSLNQDKSILNQFVKWLQDKAHIVGNPMSDIERTKPKQDRRFDDWVLTEPQVVAILEAASRRHPRDRMVVALGLYGGLRDSEMTDLQAADVNLRTRTMDYFREKQDERYRAPINGALAREFERYFEWYTAHYGAMDPHWYVCPHRTFAAPARYRMERMEPRWRIEPHVKAYSFIRDVKALLAEIGMRPLPNQGVHVLRRTFAWMLLQETGDIRKVMVALGHKQQATTERYLFRNVESEQLRGHYEREDFRLWGQPDPTPAGDNVVNIATWHRRGA